MPGQLNLDTHADSLQKLVQYLTLLAREASPTGASSLLPSVKIFTLRSFSFTPWRPILFMIRVI